MISINKSTPDAFPHIAEMLAEQEADDSRIGDMKEEWMVSVTSENPRERFLMRPKINWAFGMQECWAFWDGANPGHVHRYNSQMEEYMYKKDTDNKVKLHGSAYGRYFRHMPHDQIRRVIRQLNESPETRRAQITVHNPYVEDYDRNDVACTKDLHFVIRDGELHLTASMRSQDMLWGYPYDTQVFQWMQEMIAGKLEVELGTYTHVMDSCHIYTEFENRVWNAVDNAETYTAPDMRIFEHSAFRNSMSQGLRRARNGEIPTEEASFMDDMLGRAYGDWLRMMTAYEQYRFHDDQDKVRSIVPDVYTEPFSEWLHRTVL